MAETPWTKGKKSKATRDAHMLGHNHHRIAVNVELEDVLKHMEGLPEEEAKAFDKAWKKAEKEKQKAVEKAEKEWEKTSEEVTTFTKPFIKKLNSVVQSCSAEEDETTGESEFSTLLGEVSKLLTLKDNFNAFVLEFHHVLPILRQHFESKTKGKTAAKKDLAFFERFHDLCWDQENEKPKAFSKLRVQLLTNGMAGVGLG